MVIIVSETGQNFWFEMPAYVGVRARLNYGRNNALSKAFSMCCTHMSYRERDSYFGVSKKNFLKVKQLENILDGEKSIMLLSYNKEPCSPDSGLTLSKSTLDFSAKTESTACLEKCYAQHTFQGMVEKVREEFLIMRNGYAVMVLVDKLNKIGDYFQVKIAVDNTLDVENAKWIAKRICFEFNIAPKDVFSAPVCYYDLLTVSEILSQKQDVRMEQIAKMNRIKRERIIQEKLAKYNELMKKKKQNVLRFAQRRRQWRRRNAIRVRQILQEKGVKASALLKRVREIKKARAVLKATVKGEGEEAEASGGSKYGVNLNLPIKKEEKGDDDDDVQVVAHYSKRVTW